MSSLLRFLSSSVGTKILVALTGLGFAAFLVMHLAANLLVLVDVHGYNEYSHKLITNPLIYIAEAGLVVLFLVHAFKAVMVTLRNREARGRGYAVKKRAGHTSRKSLASSTMIVSGVWLLAFLIVHVKAFRFSPTYPWGDGGRDLFRQEMENLSNPFVAGFYVLSMIVVGSHLWHGISSALQSLGLDHPRWTPRVLMAGKVFSVAIAGAFIVIAVWVYLRQAVA